MKRRVRPILYTRDQTMFHGIVVNVIDVSCEIVFVTDSVFPISPLPKRKLAVGVSLDADTSPQQATAEVSFHTSPAPGEIRISLRQRKDCMKVIGQNHDRVDREGAFVPRHAKGRTKRVDVIDKRSRPPIFERKGEEERSRLNAIAPVPDHAA